MNRKHVIGTILIAIVSSTLGGLVGFIAGTCSDMKSQIKATQRQKDMQLKTEDYSPTCEQLKSVHMPQFAKKGNDYFAVVGSEKYFVVFGFNAEPGKVPVTAWWGADRDEAIKKT
jgi:membrane protein YqaA with SNARE-associated domain